VEDQQKKVEEEGLLAVAVVAAVERLVHQHRQHCHRQPWNEDRCVVVDLLLLLLAVGPFLLPSCVAVDNHVTVASHMVEAAEDTCTSS
jgi:hypothetical protein